MGNLAPDLLALRKFSQKLNFHISFFVQSHYLDGNERTIMLETTVEARTKVAQVWMTEEDHKAIKEYCRQMTVALGGHRKYCFREFLLDAARAALKQ